MKQKNDGIKYWDNEEDEILIDLHKEMSIEQIEKSVKLPGRTKKAIISRIHRLIVKGSIKPKSAKRKTFGKSIERTSNPDISPVKGYTEHKIRRFNEIHERERNYNKIFSEEIKKYET